MLGLHLVLVTLQGQFTISIEQDKQNLVVLNVIFCAVFSVPFPTMSSKVIYLTLNY